MHGRLGQRENWAFPPGELYEEAQLNCWAHHWIWTDGHCCLAAARHFVNGKCQGIVSQVEFPPFSKK